MNPHTEPRIYERRQANIEAMQYDGLNGEAVEFWSAGRMIPTFMKSGIPILTYYMGGQMTIVWAGDFVIREFNGTYHHMSETAFFRAYAVPA